MVGAQGGPQHPLCRGARDPLLPQVGLEGAGRQGCPGMEGGGLAEPAGGRGAGERCDPHRRRPVSSPDPPKDLTRSQWGPGSEKQAPQTGPASAVGVLCGLCALR